MKKLSLAVGLLSLTVLVALAGLPAVAAPLAKPVPTPTPDTAGMAPDPDCPVTPLAQASPPGPEFADSAGRWYRNDALWAAGGWQWTAGPDGAKVMWYRSVPGKLTVTGRRLDGLGGGRLVAHIPEGYGDQGFQATGLYFPTGGCWEVTGELGGLTMTFVVRVALGDAPSTIFPGLARQVSNPYETSAFTDVDRRRLYVALPHETDPAAFTVLVLYGETMVNEGRKQWPAFCEQLLVIGANGDWICAYGDGEERLVRILNIDFDNTGVPRSLGYVPGPVVGAAMTRTGRMYVVSKGAQVVVVDVPQRRILYYKRLTVPEDTANLPRWVMLSPDGRRLYLGFEPGGERAGAAQVVRAYDVANWKVLGDFDFGSEPAVRLSLSDRGDRLYGIGERGRVSVYDTASFERAKSES